MFNNIVKNRFIPPPLQQLPVQRTRRHIECSRVDQKMATCTTQILKPVLLQRTHLGVRISWLAQGSEYRSICPDQCAQILGRSLSQWKGDYQFSHQCQRSSNYSHPSTSRFPGCGAVNFMNSRQQYDRP